MPFCYHILLISVSTSGLKICHLNQFVNLRRAATALACRNSSPRLAFIQYAREDENCIENSRRNEWRGPYCLEKREKSMQESKSRRYCIDRREESPRWHGSCVPRRAGFARNASCKTCAIQDLQEETQASARYLLANFGFSKICKKGFLQNQENF